MRFKKIFHHHGLAFQVEHVSIDERPRHAVRMINAVVSEEASQRVVLPEAEAVTNAHAETKVKLPVLLLREGEKLLFGTAWHFSSKLFEWCAEDLRINIAFRDSTMLATNHRTQENENCEILHDGFDT